MAFNFLLGNSFPTGFAAAANDLTAGAVNPAVTAGIMALLVGLMFVWLILCIGFYIYSALTLSAVARRTKTKEDWFAWIPFANIVLMTRIAKMHWWPILLLAGGFVFYILGLIPYIGVLFAILYYLCLLAYMVFTIIWTWKICEARNRPGWWAVIVLVPVVGWIWNLVMWGILAWAKD